MFQNMFLNPPRRVAARRFPSNPLANRAWCPRHSAAACPLLKFASVNINENASRLQSVQYLLRCFPEKCIWCERGSQKMCIFDHLGPVMKSFWCAENSFLDEKAWPRPFFCNQINLLIWVRGYII